MENRDTERADATLLVHDERHAEGAVAPPIYQTSLFTFDSYEAMADRFRGASARSVYSRVDNPTVAVLLDKMCRLERGERALAFASGIAAISSAILGLTKSGDRVVCTNHVYPDTYRLLRGLCARFGIETTFVDGTDPAAFGAALPGATLAYLESPNSWVMQEQDLAAVASLAKAANVTTIVDNSWATPLLQKPLEAGIDLVVHSASKYISGHSDVVAGLLVGEGALVERLAASTTPYLGAKLSAHEAALLLRGLRTLPLRLARHQESALAIARRLEALDDVVTVHHPGLRPAAHSLLRGYGGLFSFEVSERIDVPALCDALSLFRLGVSWGGHESLAMPAQISIEQAGEHSSAVDFAVSPRLIRLFVGLEDADELWADLEQAIGEARVRG